jgi:hypothetical protein
VFLHPTRTRRAPPNPHAPSGLSHAYYSGTTNWMEAIPAKLTPRLVEEMDELIREGWYANRSELIRDAVREAIRRARAQRLEAAIKEDISWGLLGKD